MSETKTQVLADLIQTVHRLRAPGGCPWDRAQDHQSLRPYLIEEAYEVLDVLDQIKSKESLKDPAIYNAFREELGDLLMQVLLHSEMVSEEGVFDIYDVATELNSKLVRRHPHVFGNEKAEDADSALSNWEQQKAKEKAKNPNASVLDGLPKNLPALQKGTRTIEKVTKVGFQWEDLKGPMNKILEEVSELKTEVEALEKENNETQRAELKKRAEAELGDVFFTLCNLSFLLKINPEDALRTTLNRFERRFRFVEKRLKGQGKTPTESNLEEMDRYWNEAKEVEKKE